MFVAELGVVIGCSVVGILLVVGVGGMLVHHLKGKTRTPYKYREPDYKLMDRTYAVSISALSCLMSVCSSIQHLLLQNTTKQCQISFRYQNRVKP